MIYPTQALLLGMRAHCHEPNMPRIRKAAAVARCLKCGYTGAVPEGPDGEALPERSTGPALTLDCPNSASGTGARG